MARNRKEEQRKRRVTSARDRAEKHGSEGRNTVKLPDDASFFSVKAEGTKRIDIIPYVVGEGNPYADPDSYHYERTYWVHRGIGPNNETHVCPAKTFKKPCPVCEYRGKLAKDPDADDKTVKDLLPKERQLFNVVDAADPDKGVQVWDWPFWTFGRHLDGKVKNADPEDGYEYFADPEKGFRLKIGITEQSGGSYSFFDCADIEFKPREPLDEEIVNAAHCLDDLIIEPDYDELKKLFLQTGDAVSKNGKPSAKAKKADDDEDDEEEIAAADDDDDFEDEDDEDEAPPKKPGKKGAKPFKVHDLVTYKNKECEVLAIAKNGTLTLEDPNGKEVKGVDPEDVVKVPVKDDEEEDDDEDEAPPKKVGKKGAKASADDEDDDDYEDEEEDEEDFDDDDDAFEDEEEDEEEEVPVAKKRGRPASSGKKK